MHRCVHAVESMSEGTDRKNHTEETRKAKKVTSETERVKWNKNNCD